VSRTSKKKQEAQPDPATEAYLKGLAMVRRNPALDSLDASF